jgi:hypothetical protein
MEISFSLWSAAKIAVTFFQALIRQDILKGLPLEQPSFLPAKPVLLSIIISESPFSDFF